jgi:hypothetical protein
LTILIPHNGLRVDSFGAAVVVWEGEACRGGVAVQVRPKGNDLNGYPGHELERITAELNDRPRRCLGDRTPAQLMRKWHRSSSAAICDDP